MLPLLVSLSIVGDRGKALGKGAPSTLDICFPGVGVIEIRTHRSSPMSFHLLPIGCQDANLGLYIRFTAAALRLTVQQSINMCQAKENIWREG